MKIQHVYILGDTHGDWAPLNEFINKEIRQNKNLKNESLNNDVEVIFLQVGDFGWWPHAHNPMNKKGLLGKFDQFGIKNSVDFLSDGHIKFYWCDGNHENHESLDTLEKNNPNSRFIEVMPFVYYCAFGAVLKLNDDKKVLFCGGADSIDKSERTPMLEWWPNETISYSDMSHLDENEKIDIVISHTCPNYFDIWEEMNKNNNSRVSYLYHDTFFGKAKDPSKDALNIVYDMFKPKMWFFGHYHKYLNGNFESTKWTMLPHNRSCEKWWIKLN